MWIYRLVQLSPDSFLRSSSLYLLRFPRHVSSSSEFMQNLYHLRPTNLSSTYISLVSTLSLSTREYSLIPRSPQWMSVSFHTIYSVMVSLHNTHISFYQCPLKIHILLSTPTHTNNRPAVDIHSCFLYGYLRTVVLECSSCMSSPSLRVALWLAVVMHL